MNKTRNLVLCAVCAAITCVLAPLSIPLAAGVPISLATFAVMLAGVLLGGRLGAVSQLVYLLLGAVGMPVFSGYQGGLGKLAGPTGGYLVGFVFLSLICGAVVERFYDRPLLCIAGMIAGDLTLFVFGTAWFVLEMKCQVWYALTVCVFPFLPFDLIKMVIAAFLGKGVRSALEKSGLLPQRA
jgi:biotin transport system substrate-specific component